MELTEKTTILLPAWLHRHLKRVAQRKNVSMGKLIRDACEEKYVSIEKEDRETALNALQKLALPVDNTEKMKAESVVSAEEIVP